MKFLLSLLIFLFLFIQDSNAQVRINEFLIDPSQKIELFNPTLNPFDISGWFIDDSSGTTYFTVPQDTIISPNSCSVFESDFNLNKTSADTVRLFNATAPPTSTQSALIDSFSYKASSGSGVSFKRLPDAGPLWSTGSADIGFYNNTTLSCIAIPTPTTTPTMIPTPTVTPILQLYGNIYLSEVMVNPDEESEWVELYNDNDFKMDLVDWYLDDGKDSGSSPKKFSISIDAKSYAVYAVTSSMFNNDGDSVRLLDFSSLERDSVSYSVS